MGPTFVGHNLASLTSQTTTSKQELNGVNFYLAVILELLYNTLIKILELIILVFLFLEDLLIFTLLNKETSKKIVICIEC